MKFSSCNLFLIFHESRNDLRIFHLPQIFFDDSARNIASGKVAGLHTVIVSYDWLYVLKGKKLI